ncbi:hypothetical protein OIU80_17555 [Flavobacterium sp. LS1R47]|uniref:Uncharacterized protein n=1 Tax=Flavobacterium frigoritolerans TaxID=2987686 RepID=A0A9X3C9J4_9FLAO|nr:hypothetical protein [Flavobacterium frigoritolerans]MCV9934091.1 hypothetical protein [Flavobacterium frigoritolerans]
MENNKISILKINNIDNEVQTKIVEVINSFENNFSIPAWFIFKLKNLTEDDLWKNEYLMDYNTWIKKIENKKWKIGKIKTDNLYFEISFILENQTNFSEILCIISLLEINLDDVYIDDYYFGVYSPSKLP